MRLPEQDNALCVMKGARAVNDTVALGVYEQGEPSRLDDTEELRSGLVDKQR